MPAAPAAAQPPAAKPPLAPARPVPAAPLPAVAAPTTPPAADDHQRVASGSSGGGERDGGGGAAAGEDDDEALLQQLLRRGRDPSGGGGGTAAAGAPEGSTSSANASFDFSRPSGSKASLTAGDGAKQPGGGPPSASSASSAAAIRDALVGGADDGPFGLSSEERTLKAIISALSESETDHVDGVPDMADVERALEHARRLSALGKSSCHAGQNVLAVHESFSVSQELAKAKGSIGQPQCLAVMDDSQQSGGGRRMPLIAVGTAVGLVVLFRNDKLLGVCGSLSASAEARGGVASVALSDDLLTLAVGYERGQVVLWDVASLEPLKAISGDFKDPVHCVRFIDPLKVIAADPTSGGAKVYLFGKIVSKLVYRTASVSFDISSPLCDIGHAVIPVVNKERHETTLHHFIAAATTDEVVVRHATISPLQVVDREVFRQPGPASVHGSNASLVWMPQRSSNQVLCVAWGSVVHFFSAVVLADGPAVIATSVMPALPAAVRAMSALDQETLLVLDEADAVHLLDIGVQQIVESMTLFAFDVVIYSHRSCGMRCHNSIANVRQEGGKTFLLGKAKLLSCSVVTWEQRLDTLVMAKDWKTAMELAQGFLANTATAVVGLPESPELRTRAVVEYLNQLVTSMIADTMRRRPSEAEVLELMRSTIEYCSRIAAVVGGGSSAASSFNGSTGSIGRSTGTAAAPLPDLFTTATTFFLNLSQELLLVQAVERAILVDGVLNTLPVDFLSRLVTLLSADGPGKGANLERLENMLLRIAGQEEDLLAIAKEHDLWRLVCAVWQRRGQPDAAFVELSGLADKVLVHFVNGVLRERTVFGEPTSDGPDVIARSQALILSGLLKMPAATVKLFAEFRTDLFDGLHAVCQKVAGERGSPWLSTMPGSASPKDAVSKQAFFDALRRMLVPDDASDSKRPWVAAAKAAAPRGGIVPVAVIAEFYCLFAMQWANGQLQFSAERDVVLTLQRAVFAMGQVHGDPSTSWADRRRFQLSLARLFRSSGAFPKGLLAAQGEVRMELEQRRMSRAVAALFVTMDKYQDALRQYLDHCVSFARGGGVAAGGALSAEDIDPVIHTEVFVFLDDLVRAAPTEELRNRVRKTVKDNLSALVAVNPSDLARFVHENLPGDFLGVLQCLQGSAEFQYLYLREMLAQCGSSVDTDQDLQTRYIALLCDREPTKVYPYLVDHDGQISYDLDATLTVCEACHVTDACIFLLEKTFQIERAMQLLTESINDLLSVIREEVVVAIKEKLETYRSRANDSIGGAGGLHSSLNMSLHSLMQLSFVAGAKTAELSSPGASRHASPSRPPHAAVTVAAGSGVDALVPVSDSEARLVRMVDVGIQLCTRYGSKLDAKELRAAWFSLLDLFAMPKRIVADRLTRSQDLRRISRPTVSLDDTADVTGLDDTKVDEPTDFADELVVNMDPSLRSPVAPAMLLLTKPLSLAGHTYHLEMQALYAKYVSYVLAHMVRALDLPTVVEKIVRDNERDRFGVFKPIIVSILESLQFDVMATALCLKCTNADVLKLHEGLRATMSVGIAPVSDTCFICRRHISVAADEFATVRLMRCGHIFHSDCCGSSSTAASVADCPQCIYISRYGSDSQQYTAAAAPQRTSSSSSDAAARGAGSASAAEPGAAPVEAAPTDIAALMRRLRLVRNKLDPEPNRFLNILDALRSTTATSSSAAGGNAALKLVDGGRQRRALVLSPAGLEPTGTGDITVGAIQLPQAFRPAEMLTEEQILELFGVDGKYVAPPETTHEVGGSTAAPSTGGGDGDDDDADLDAQLQWQD